LYFAKICQGVGFCKKTFEKHIKPNIYGFYRTDKIWLKIVGHHWPIFVFNQDKTGSKIWPKSTK